jgi:hypothetical protein
MIANALDRSMILGFYLFLAVIGLALLPYVLRVVAIFVYVVWSLNSIGVGQ